MTLLGWAAYYGSVLLAAQLAFASAWLVVLALATGVVARLATLVVALRMVARHLGAPDLLRQTIPTEVVDDDRDQHVSRLLTLTLLPFLGVYAGFGYVDSFARDVIVLNTFSQGPADLLNKLNPSESVVTTWAVVAAVIVIYVIRRLLDKIFDRSKLTAVGLVAVFLEAVLLLLITLSGFRIIQSLQLWLGERAVAQWWDSALKWLSGLIHFDLPDAIERLADFVVQYFWPVFWEALTQPIAWITLTALVFGSRVLSLGDLLPGGSGTARRAIPAAPRLRGVTVEVQEAFFGDFTEKYLPTWLALKMVMKAGWKLLAAYILVFNILHLSAQWILAELQRFLGGAPYITWVKIGPFLGLITDVLMLSIQIALLGVSFTQIIAKAADRDTGGPALPRRPLTRIAEVALVGLLVAGFTAISMLKPSESFAGRSADLGQESRVDSQKVRVDSASFGAGLSIDGSEPVRSSVAFVVVSLAVHQPLGAETESIQVVLTNGSRRYLPGQWLSTGLSSTPGFRTSAQLGFEVNPADLNGDLVAELQSGAFVTGFHDVVEVNLALPPSASTDFSGHTIAANSGTTREVP